MKNTDHFNIPYPETTDLVSQFPDQVAKSTAELIDTFLYEQEQKQTALDEALDGKAPLSHTHSTSQVTGLDTALAGKAASSHTHSTSQVTGLDTALAGKAASSHTHSTSQVTGLDTALAGKAPLATLNTRVPENLALRIDTSVGTRVFAGNTMIFGEFPWVDISHLLETGWSGQVYAYRSTDSMTLRFNALTAGEGAGITVLRTPVGLRPRTYATTARWELPAATTPAQYWRGQFSTGGTLTVLAMPTTALYGDFSMPVDSQWPVATP